MKKIHFIGICGAGMSAVAKLCQDMGMQVSGSDEGFYPPISEYLLENNLKFIKGHSKNNLLDENGLLNVDIIVIGKHAKLVPEENEEVAFAFELKNENKIQIYSFPEVLQKITDGSWGDSRENILCVGSFGKSTTTSLMAHLLEYNKKDVGYFIGAAPFTPKTNAHIGTHKNFILEGDEYPSSNWDNTSKFLHLNAHDLLLTALAHDHVNIFKTHEDYKEPFFKLIKQIPTDGIVMLCIDDSNIKEELDKIKTFCSKVLTYSLNNTNADYYATEIVFGETTKFNLNNFGTLETTLLGRHNIQNVVGVCALLLEKKLLTFDEIKLALKSFAGVKRRLDLLTASSKQVKIYEGFGSSYDKARAAIEAITLHYPNKDLVILFEPHTFSWRNLDAISWYDDVFKEAKKIFVYQPPLHGAATHNQLTQTQIVNRILESKHNNNLQEVYSIVDKDTGIKLVLENLDLQKDIILILTSGDMGGIIKELPDLVS